MGRDEGGLQMKIRLLVGVIENVDSTVVYISLLMGSGIWKHRWWGLPKHNRQMSEWLRHREYECDWRAINAQQRAKIKKWKMVSVYVYLRRSQAIKQFTEGNKTLRGSSTMTMTLSPWPRQWQRAAFIRDHIGTCSYNRAGLHWLIIWCSYPASMWPFPCHI